MARWNDNLSISDIRAMKEMMTAQEAYDKGLYQIANLLERDNRIRKSLGMMALKEAINDNPGKGRPRRTKTNSLVNPKE